MESGQKKEICMGTTTGKILTRLEPIEFDLWVGYKCPECGSTLYLSSAQVKVKGQIVQCCNIAWRIKDVESIDISLGAKAGVKSVKDKTVKDEVKGIRDLTSPIRVLVGQGYTRDEAKRMLTKVYQRDVSDTDLIKNALASIT